MSITPGTPAQFVRYFGNVRARTARLVPLIPENEFEWRVQSGTFSFGDLLRHLAGLERWMWAENVCRRPARYPGHGEELAAGGEAIRRYFESLHAESIAIFSGLTPEAFAAPVTTPDGTPIAAWKWLRAMVEHEAHHRGQLYLMLRMRGIATPPLFGLTSEQVRDRGSG
jgi:uncharacterized damage-inducible protein DinB